MTLYGLGILACGGPATGQRTPGGGTPLDPDPGAHTIGALAVEPDESNVWFVHQGTDPYGASLSYLTAVDSHTGDVSDVLDVSGTFDRWLLFSSPSRAIVLAQSATGETFGSIDTDQRVLLGTQFFEGANFRDPRASSSGHFVSVVGDSSGNAQLDAIDTDTFGATVMVAMTDGVSQLEAAWGHGHDWLVAVGAPYDAPSGELAHIMRWKFDPAGAPSAPDIDFTLPDLCLWPDTRNVVISPDDHWAAITLFDCPTGQDPVVVLDLTDGSYRVSNARGPVSFTPDSSTLVSWEPTDPASLQLLPLDTLAPHQVPIPVAGEFEFFVSADGNWIVCSPLGDGTLALYDPVTGHVTSVSGPHVSLSEFVARPGYPELWLVDTEKLWTLDLPTAQLEDVGLFFPVRHLNVLPSQDSLVLSEPQGGTLRFFRMSTREVTRTVEVPSPVPLFIARSR